MEVLQITEIGKLNELVQTLNEEKNNMELQA
jgi:hypothetical protein